MNRLMKDRAALIVSVVALVVACSGVAGAAGIIVGSKQIRDGSVRTQDIRRAAVRTSDVQNGAVNSADLRNDAVASTDLSNGGVQTQDIGTDQVQPSDLDLPDPSQEVETSVATADVGEGFALVDPVEIYAKVDPASVLEVTWTGSAKAGFAPCQFQLRVDGQPAPDGAGTLYVPNGTVEGNVSVTAMFSGLPEGPHEISVYARATAPGTFPCTVGPGEAGISQTFVTAEQVI